MMIQRIMFLPVGTTTVVLLYLIFLSQEKLIINIK